MAHINLLPWREEAREERKKKFITVVVINAVIAAALLYGVIWFVDGLITEQKSRNSYLQKEVKSLDLKIKEISQIDVKRDTLLSKIDVVESLQN